MLLEGKAGQTNGSEINPSLPNTPNHFKQVRLQKERIYVILSNKPELAYCRFPKLKDAINSGIFKVVSVFILAKNEQICLPCRGQTAFSYTMKKGLL